MHPYVIITRYKIQVENCSSNHATSPCCLQMFVGDHSDNYAVVFTKVISICQYMPFLTFYVVN